MSRETSSSSSSGGIGFIGLLTIVFITLKLTGYIDWSWWWVLSPIWTGFAAVLAILAVVFGFLGAASFGSKIGRKSRKASK